MDIIAIGPHPDDVELGCGGTLALHKQAGYSFGIVDLTAGEKGSNGSIDERKKEAENGAKVLGASFRLCLQMPDAVLEVTRDNLNKIIMVLREYRPKIVLAPYANYERHPDHSAAGQLVQKAFFLAGLKKLDLPGKPFRSQRLYYYLLTTSKKPDAVIDITRVYDKKNEAIMAHKSQFIRDSSRELSQVNSPKFLHYINSRDAYFGSLVGTYWGEGIVLEKIPRVKDLLAWEGVN